MILRTCDRCGAEMKPLYFPPYPVTYCVAGENKPVYHAEVYVSVTESDGQIRPVDLCEKCNAAVHNYIFDWHDEKTVITNG